MYNIEIYIDTCEDQATSTPNVRLDERHAYKVRDDDHRFLKTSVSAWFASSEEKQIRIIDIHDGRLNPSQR
jgi:hypothetical protein